MYRTLCEQEPLATRILETHSINKCVPSLFSFTGEPTHYQQRHGVTLSGMGAMQKLQVGFDNLPITEIAWDSNEGECCQTATGNSLNSKYSSVPLCFTALCYLNEVSIHFMH